MNIEKAMPFLKSKESGVRYSKNRDGVEVIYWTYMGPFLSRQSAEKIFYFKNEKCDSIVFKLIKGADIPNLLSTKGFQQTKYDSIPPDQKPPYNPYIRIYRYYTSGLTKVTYILAKENKRFDYRKDEHLIFTKP